MIFANCILMAKVKESCELQLNLLDLINGLFMDVNPIPSKRSDEFDGNAGWGNAVCHCIKMTDSQIEN